MLRILICGDMNDDALSVFSHAVTSSIGSKGVVDAFLIESSSWKTPRIQYNCNGPMNVVIV